MSDEKTNNEHVQETPVSETSPTPETTVEGPGKDSFGDEVKEETPVEEPQKSPAQDEIEKAPAAKLSRGPLIMAIAAACHAANREWCRANGDDSQPTWDDAPQWQRDSAINGVDYRLRNPNAKPWDQHENWLAVKRADGWVYGEVKDAEKKTHPCMVAYDELPELQKKKDALFGAIVDALK